MSSALTVEAALDVLYNIDQDLLQPYKPKALLAFRKLRIFVEGLGPASTRASSDCDPLSGGIYSSSSSIPSTENQNSLAISPNYSSGPLDSHSSSIPPSTDERSVARPKIDWLIQRLDSQSTQIQTFLSQPELKALSGEPEWVKEDPRIVDLKLDGGRSSTNTRFRKGLSQRSLAMEYSEWELKVFGTSKVDELVRGLLIHDLSFSLDYKSGHIAKYIQSNNRFTDKATARVGISHGIKLLVIERLLSSNSTSAILSFGFRHLRAINFEEFDYLTTRLKSLEWVVVILNQTADWFNNCQKIYDEWCQKYSRGNKPQYRANPTQKRRRLSPEISNIAQTPTGHDSRELDRAECTTEQCNDNSTGSIELLATAATMSFTHQDASHQNPTDHMSEHSKRRRRLNPNSTLTMVHPQTTTRGQEVDIQADLLEAECTTVQYNDNSTKFVKSSTVLPNDAIRHNTHQDAPHQHSTDCPSDSYLGQLGRQWDGFPIDLSHPPSDNNLLALGKQWDGFSIESSAWNPFALGSGWDTISWEQGTEQ